MSKVKTIYSKNLKLKLQIKKNKIKTEIKDFKKKV